MDEVDALTRSNYNDNSLNFSMYDSSDYLDISSFSPRKMMNNVANMKNTVDPALLPIQSYEVKVLVRLLHQISCLINEKVRSLILT